MNIELQEALAEIEIARKKIEIAQGKIRVALDKKYESSEILLPEYGGCLSCFHAHRIGTCGVRACKCDTPIHRARVRKAGGPKRERQTLCICAHKRREHFAGKKCSPDNRSFCWCELFENRAFETRERR